MSKTKVKSKAKSAFCLPFGKVIAFWGYDLYPYCLSGEVVEASKELGEDLLPEWIKARGYDGMWFKPIALIPADLGGKQIAEALDILRKELENKKNQLHREYVEKAKAIANFIK